MRRWLLPTALYALLALAVTRPILRYLGTIFPHDAGDPVLNTWILWWSTQRLPITEGWWNAPMFFPTYGALAFSEVLIGLLPITAPVQWLTGSPLVAYNVAFIVSFLMSGVAAYALALELTGRRDAAFVAGVACAFAPYRIGQMAHIQVLSYYWMPISLLGLHRYIRTDDSRWLVVFAGGWLLQSLSNGYALFHFSVLVAIWIVWFARSRRHAPRIVAAWLVALALLTPVLLKYWQIHSSLHLVRDINEIREFSVDLADVFTAPPELTLWGPLLGPGRRETAVFPGATVLAMAVIWIAISWRDRQSGSLPRSADYRILIALSAIAGLVALSTVVYGPWALGPLTVTRFYKPFSIAVLFRILAFMRGPWFRQAWRDRSTVAFYAIAAVGMYILAMGPEPRLLGRPILYEAPYAWLMRLPGVDELRVPARFAMVAILCQAVLLAFAVARWSWRPVGRQIAFNVILVGLLVDGWTWLGGREAPRPGPAWQDVDAVVELPLGRPADFGAIYRGISYGRPIVNGYSGYYPPHYLPLMYALRDGHYSALSEVARGQPLGIAVDRTSKLASVIEPGIDTMPGVTSGPEADRWASFVLKSSPPQTVRFGPSLSVTTVQANRHPEDVERMRDGTVRTAWASGLSQIGDEEIVIDLGSEQRVGGIVLGMGSYAFGFPRDLSVEASSDQRTWVPQWSGQTSVPTVHAAVTEPLVVPVKIDLGALTARYLRLRQTGTEAGIPWWIGELDVCAPAGNSGSH